MSDVPAERRAVIVGIGHTEFSQNSGRCTLQLAAEAVAAAIRRRRAHPAPTSTAPSPSRWTCNDELALIRCAGCPSCASRPARVAAAAARAPPCSSPPPPWRAATPTPCSSTAPSTSGPATASANRSNGRVTPTRRGTSTCRSGSTRRRRSTPSGFQRYMHEHDLTNVDFGRYPSSPATGPAPTRTPRSTSGPSPSRTTRPVAGSSNPSCASSTAARRATAASRWWSPEQTGPRDLDPPCPSTSSRPPRRTCEGGSEMFAYYDQDLGEHQEAAAMGRRLYAEPASRPTTSTSP